METLKVVTYELFIFVFVEYFGFRQKFVTTRFKPTYLVSPRPVGGSVSSYIIPEKIQLEPEAINTPNSTQTLIPAETATVIELTAQLFISPVVAFDSVIATLKYGQTVSILSSSNRWYKVDCGEQTGWILRDSVTLNNIHPQFKYGQIYNASNKETAKLRAYINDEFAGRVVDVPLTDVEYVTYKLLKKGHCIVWGSDRPRTAGRWQTLLRGQEGIHISIMPQTDSVMEYITEDDLGHLVYVDAVFPDESILISEIGFPDLGQYSERTLLKDEWREFRPIFIDVT